MKLLQKSSLYYLAILVPTLVISGLVFYLIISMQIDDNADESLLAQKKLIETHLMLNDSIYFGSYEDADEDVLITPSKQKLKAEDKFSDIMLYSDSKAEWIPCRQLKSSFEKNGRYASITITRSKVKSEELVQSISVILVLMFGVLLVGFIVINQFVSRLLWRPFYESLDNLNSISFANMELNMFPASSIQEFDEMNKAINKMIEKLFKDYANQKQFTENASHELQTPLAVIKSRIDLLIQSKLIEEDDMFHIQEIEKFVNKLSYLNKSLLLLSKIENRQFDEALPVELASLINRIITNYDDRIVIKNITIQKEFKEQVVLQLNPFLTEILLSNLIQNAVRYTIEGGVIKIELTANYFSISNTGLPIKENVSQIFNRFTRFNSSSDSLGLGLSIVKQICEYYGFNILYTFEEGLHCFRVQFEE